MTKASSLVDCSQDFLCPAFRLGRASPQELQLDRELTSIRQWPGY